MRIDRRGTHSFVEVDTFHACDRGGQDILQSYDVRSNTVVTRPLYIHPVKGTVSLHQRGKIGPQWLTRAQSDAPAVSLTPGAP